MNAQRRLLAWLSGLLLALAGLQASAQQDPPSSVASVLYSQGRMSFSPAGESSWFDLMPNRPLTSGDRLWTERGARAEVSVGSLALRLDEQTAITLAAIDDGTVRITVSEGSIQLRVREDPDGRRVEIDTANLALVVDGPGDYRIEADTPGGTTRVAVAAGQATLFGENGESQQLGARQQLTASGRNLQAVSAAPVRAGGDFERFIAGRDQLADQSIAARYVSPEVVGYQELDGQGSWQNDPGYGNVWFPANVSADWAPYSDGQWVDVAPWGWTWVDAAPWGFATAHYGRWARVGPRWGWVPGRPQARPVYSPALVGFVSGAGSGHAGIPLANGRNGVGWFPLAPGEPWRPGYRASQAYVDAANAAALQRQVAHNAAFANQTAPGAVTVVPGDAFGRGPINRHDMTRPPVERIANAPVSMAPPVTVPAGHGFAGFGAPTAMQPVQQMQRQQQAQQMQQAAQAQQAQQAQLAQQAMRMQQQAAHAAQQAQQAQQAQMQRAQQEMQLRAAQAQQQQAQQMQLMQAQRQQQAQMQMQMQQQAQMQQRAVLQAQQAMRAQGHPQQPGQPQFGADRP